MHQNVVYPNQIPPLLHMLYLSILLSPYHCLLDITIRTVCDELFGHTAISDILSQQQFTSVWL
jgi:hypothetical protein